MRLNVLELFTEAFDSETHDIAGTKVLWGLQSEPDALRRTSRDDIPGQQRHEFTDVTNAFRHRKYHVGRVAVLATDFPDVARCAANRMPIAAGLWVRARAFGSTWLPAPIHSGSTTALPGSFVEHFGQDESRCEWPDRFKRSSGPGDGRTSGTEVCHQKTGA
jgi:hypothetical protein